MTFLLYLGQLTIISSFVAMIYCLGRHRLRGCGKRLLIAGMLSLMLLSASTAFPVYEWLTIPRLDVGQTRLPASANEGAGENETNLVFTGWRWPEFLLQVLGAAIAIRVVFFGVELVRLVRLTRRSSTISILELAACNQHLSRQLNELESDYSGGRIRFAVSNEIDKAATFGIWHQVILLPVDWGNWSPTKLAAVVTHELEHVRRFDCVFRIVTELITAIHFYHPIVRWLANQFRLEQEFAADQAVLNHLGAVEYETLLVQESLGIANYRQLLLAPSFSVNSKSILRSRIERIREHRQFPEQDGRRWYVGVLAALAFLLLVVCGIQVDASQSSQTLNVNSTSTLARVQDTAPTIKKSSIANATSNPDTQRIFDFSKMFTLNWNSRQLKDSVSEESETAMAVDKTYSFTIGD